MKLLQISPHTSQKKKVPIINRYLRFYFNFIICTFLFDQKVFEDFWPRLRAKIPLFFKGIEVKPSLLHGDLWAENAAQKGSKPGKNFINLLLLLHWFRDNKYRKSFFPLKSPSLHKPLLIKLFY